MATRQRTSVKVDEQYDAGPLSSRAPIRRANLRRGLRYEVYGNLGGHSLVFGYSASSSGGSIVAQARKAYPDAQISVQDISTLVSSSSLPRATRYNALHLVYILVFAAFALGFVFGVTLMHVKVRDARLDEINAYKHNCEGLRIDHGAL